MIVEFVYFGDFSVHPSKKIPLDSPKISPLIFFAENSPHYVCLRYFCSTK